MFTLEERRRAVFLRWVDITIGLDRSPLLIPKLLVANQHDPFDEGICLRLMAALQQTGRSAEALDVYRRTKRLLRRDLGIDPDDTLQTAGRNAAVGARVARCLGAVRSLTRFVE